MEKDGELLQLLRNGNRRTMGLLFGFPHLPRGHADVGPLHGTNVSAVGRICDAMGPVRRRIIHGWFLHVLFRILLDGPWDSQSAPTVQGARGDNHKLL